MDYVTRQFINLTKKFRKELRKALQDQTDAIRDATKASRENKQEPLPMPLPIRAELQLPEAKENERTKREKRTLGIQIWLAVVTTLAFIAAAIYAGVAASQSSTFNQQLTAMNKTYGEIQKQTTMMRQQLVGTQAAVIEVSPPVWNPTTQSLSITLVNVNQGAVAGTVTSFRANLQRKTWPAEKPIGEPLPIELMSPITLVKGGQFAVEKSPPWPLPPKLKDQRSWPGKEIVILEGSYTYRNGFDDSLSGTFCYLWLPPWDLTMPTPTQGGWSGGQWSGGKRGCPPVQEKINEFVGYEKHIVEVTTPHHP